MADVNNKSIGYIVTRIDSTINREGLASVKKAGFDLLIYGLESGSEKVLKAMNKRINTDQTSSILRLSKDCGVNTGAFWVIGHPGDNPEEAKKSLKFMESLYVDDILDRSIIHRFIPYPGTAFFNNPREYGVEIFHYN